MLYHPLIQKYFFEYIHHNSILKYYIKLLSQTKELPSFQKTTKFKKGFTFVDILFRSHVNQANCN